MGTLQDYLCKFMITSSRILLRMRSVSGKSCRESQNAHFMFNNFYFSLKIVLFMRYVEKYGGVR